MIRACQYGTYDTDTATYTLDHNAGFFSHVGVALFDISIVVREGFPVRHIDMSRAYVLYRDTPDTDVHRAVFEEATDAPDLRLEGDQDAFAIRARAAARGERLGWGRLPIDLIPFGMTTPTLDAFYRFRPEIEDLSMRMQEASGIEPERTFCFYFRGTDKGAHKRALDYADQVADVVAGIKEAHPGLDLLIQSDDGPALARLKTRLARWQAKVIEGVPISEDGRAMHRYRPEARRMAELKLFLAAFLVMKRCRRIVATVSNVTTALALYRGGTHGLTVIHNDGSILLDDGSSALGVPAT